MPDINGIPLKYFPRVIVKGLHMDFKKHFKVVFGYYMEAHDNPTVIKNMNSMKHEYIDLGKSINMQGALEILCLDMERALEIIRIITMVAT